MSRETARLLKSIRACDLCAPVLPVPPRPVLQVHPSAKILLASQAPGRVVFETGIPFNDRSGDRLRTWLGVSRELFYDDRIFAIVPMGFCFPGSGKGGDLAPRRECAPEWRARVLDQLPSIELTLAVGQYAVAYHTGGAASLTETVRDWRRFSPALIPLPHPSPRNGPWLKQHPWFERDLLPVLRHQVAEVLGTL